MNGCRELENAGASFRQLMPTSDRIGTGTERLRGDDELIVVRRRRGDWKTAIYRLADIARLHSREREQKSYVPGDLSLAGHEAMVHGYVRHKDMIAGELEHTPDACNWVRVCISRKDNTRLSYRLIRKRVGSLNGSD